VEGGKKKKRNIFQNDHLGGGGVGVKTRTRK
jgi:hypothetical protein